VGGADEWRGSFTHGRIGSIEHGKLLKNNALDMMKARGTRQWSSPRPATSWPTAPAGKLAGIDSCPVNPAKNIRQVEKNHFRDKEGSCLSQTQGLTRGGIRFVNIDML